MTAKTKTKKNVRHKWKYSGNNDGKGVCTVCGLRSGIDKVRKSYRAWYKLRDSDEKMTAMPPCTTRITSVCPHCKGTGVVTKEMP